MKKIEELTLVELKALIYDHLSSIERSKEIIKMINLEITKRSDISQEQKKDE